MREMSEAVAAAVDLVARADPELVEIVLLSLRVSVSAVIIAALIGIPAGAALAMFRFPGRQGLVIAVNALMGLPPVVVGLCVYLLVSRSGPLGNWGILFTAPAMIIAQTILIVPIVTALSRGVIEDLSTELSEQLRSLGVGTSRAMLTLIREARYRLVTAVLAGFGRAIAEVGAVLIVGGNIAHHTRVMTTAIALETSRGNLALALGLGLILIAVSLAINALVYLTSGIARRRAGA
ncbi:MAG: ABC transporter permease [Gammaproteobacteria bacterium]|nr:ABC transporter permease [Gammaproteobacteria bacterium]MCG3143297.1 Tungstate uptake system permease protein TupB [Gammaproteobacteria bacterium]